MRKEVDAEGQIRRSPRTSMLAGVEYNPRNSEEGSLFGHAEAMATLPICACSERMGSLPLNPNTEGDR